MKTKLTEMFGIKYPIVQSGMQWLAVPQLASAVCNAGGIGTINVTCWPTLDEFADALDEMNSLTSKPYIATFLWLRPSVWITKRFARPFVSAVRSTSLPSRQAPKIRASLLTTSRPPVCVTSTNARTTRSP